MMKYVELVAVYVSDHDRARDFYVDALGFNVVVDGPYNSSHRWIEVALGGDNQVTLALIKPEAPDDKRIGQHTHVVFATDDIDETYRQLHTRGVQFEGEPTGPSPEGVRACQFVDQDSNKFLLVQRPDDRWKERPGVHPIRELE
jgi:predicted enzyme related to lactoylglutathione lyase